MPDLGRVSQIDASSFDAGTAYVAVKKPLLDDFAPYIFRTHDFGKTWTKIVDRHSRQRLRARRARGSGAARAALRRHAARLLHLVRRRRSLAVAVARTCPTRRCRDIWVEANSTRDRDARPRLLHPRRHRAAAAVRGRRHDGGFHLFKPSDATRSAGSATIAYSYRSRRRTSLSRSWTASARRSRRSRVPRRTRAEAVGRTRQRV